MMQHEAKKLERSVSVGLSSRPPGEGTTCRRHEFRTPHPGTSAATKPGPVRSPQQPQGGDGGRRSENSIVGNQVTLSLL
ncbi:Hypothetical protein SMAX5B_013692, partial [Scophthalmus maximus]